MIAGPQGKTKRPKKPGPNYTWNGKKWVKTSTPTATSPTPTTSTTDTNVDVPEDVFDPNSASAVQAQADAAEKERDERNRKWQEEQDAARQKLEQDSLIQVIKAAFNDYGLSNLYSVIEGYVRKGFNEAAINMMLRDTPEYKERFPAMSTMAGKGRAITEAEYIAYERNAAQLEQAYGLPGGMLSKSVVTNLLSNDIDAQELEDRVNLAAAAAYQVDETVRKQFSDYYNISPGGLTAYFLDPDQAEPLLQKQWVASKIGAEAQKQGISIGNILAEQLGAGGITQEQARAGFGDVAQSMTLTEGRGDVVNQQDLISANFMNNADSLQKVKRAASSKSAAFQGGTDYVRTQRGDTAGLGSATR